MAIDCLPHQVRLGWRLHSAMLVVVTAAMVHAAAMHYLHPRPPAGMRWLLRPRPWRIRTRVTVAEPVEGMVEGGRRRQWR